MSEHELSEKLKEKDHKLRQLESKLIEAETLAEVSKTNAATLKAEYEVEQKASIQKIASLEKKFQAELSRLQDVYQRRLDKNNLDASKESERHAQELKEFEKKIESIQNSHTEEVNGLLKDIEARETSYEVAKGLLQDNNQKIRQHNSDTTSKLASCENDRLMDRKEIARVVEKTSTKEKQRQVLMSELAVLTSELSTLESEIKILMREKSEITRDRDMVVKRYKNRAEKYDEIADVNAETQTLLALAQSKMAVLESTNASLEKHNVELRETVNAGRHEAEELEEKLETLTNTSERLSNLSKSEATSNDKQVLSLDMRIGVLTSELQKQVDVNTSLKKKVKSLELEINQLLLRVKSP